MEGDKVTIGLTSANKGVVEDLKQRGWFNDYIDAAKFAMGLAIQAGVKPGKLEGVETVWNVGSFDNDSELRSLLPVLYPETKTPYRLVEYLLNVGLQLIANELARDPYLEPPELFTLTNDPDVTDKSNL